MDEAWRMELPVAVDLPPDLEIEVTAYLESELGWRRVPLDGPPAPVLVLAQRARSWPPSVLVFGGRDVAAEPPLPPPGALDLLVWPRDRGRLAAAAGRLPRPASAPRPARLRVAGALPGAGASTVALALGGLAAWAGQRVAVVGELDLLRLAGVRAWPGPGAGELDRLSAEQAAREFDRVARASRGVPGLWLLYGGSVPVAAGWPVDWVITDLGARGHGAGPHCLVTPGLLPASARVRRAGRAGRVPASLPGSYLAALQRGFGGRRS